MKKLLIRFSLLLLLVGYLKAQSTTLTGSVVDNHGYTWSYGTVTAVFQPSPGVPGPYNWSGGSFNQLPATVNMDSGGNFTLVVATNTSIVPSGSTWLISVCPNESLQCAVINAPLTGGSVNVTSLVTATNSWPTGNIAPTQISKVYNTAQAGTPPLNQGGMVYNTTNQTMNVYGTAGWTPFAVVGGLPVVTNPSGNQTITQPLNTIFNFITSGAGSLQHNGNVVLDTTTGVQYTPAGAQTIIQPGTSTFAANSTNGLFNEEVFTGSTIALRVNAAATACGTNPCYIVIPTYAPYGVGWTLPLPNNVTLVDQRTFNSQGFAQQTAIDLRPYVQWSMYRGTDYSFEEDEAGSGTFTGDFEARAYAGGHTGDGGRANSGALLLYSDRTAGSRPIWGMDMNMQCSNLLNLCTGLELDVVNNSGTNDSGATMQGFLDICSSNTPGTNCGTGLTVQGSNSLWKFGEVLESYSAVGLQMIPTAGRNADISIQPPADDNNIEMLGRNAANTSNTWSIDDSGNFNGSSFNGRTVSGSTGGLVAPVTFGAVPSTGGLGVLWNLSSGTGETDFVNNKASGGGGFEWFNTATTTAGAPIMTLDSTGRMNATGGFSVGSSVGVSCSGTPTSGFVSVNGIVTHC